MRHNGHVWDHRRPRAALAALAVLTLGALAACGSTAAGVTARESNTATTFAEDTTTPSPPETADTAPPATTITISIPPITEPDTVPPTEPSTAPSTGQTTTTVAGVPAGWRHVDTFPPEVFPPFDESNWSGVPSPAITTPLADGIYAASIVNAWTAEHPDTLDIVLQRLAPCTELPEDACLNFGDPYGPNDMGVAAEQFPMTITLDDSIGVGLTGYDCESIDALGNGADLATLLADFDAAYTATVAPVLAAGQDPGPALNATPVNGFSGVGGACGPDGFSVVYHDGEAPPLLLQTLSYPAIDANGNSTGRIPLTPTDVIRLDTLQVTAGTMTFYFYAGFYS